MKQNWKRLGWPCILFLILSCTGQSTEILDLESTNESTDGYIMIGSWDNNHRGVAYYDVDGNYLRHTDFRFEVGYPRGFTIFEDDLVLMSADGYDAIYSLDEQANKNLFSGSSFFNGTIIDIVYDPATQVVYAVEGNNIEAFDNTGLRLTSQLISTSTGACTLSNPRGLIVNSNGNLVVSNIGGTDDILTYDITTSPPTCLSAVPFGNNPTGLVEHTNGNLYIVTQNDDRVYSADADGSNPVVVWDTDTSIINNPGDIIQLPNGNLLVSSTATDTIEQITTTGERVGTAPFIQDALSQNIGAMIFVGELEDEEPSN